MILESLNIEEVSLLLESKKEKTDKLLKQLGYEYSFVFVFAPAVKALYPIITHIIEKWELPAEVTKESIVYLTICLIGILLNEPKAKYKALLDKVKAAKLDHLLEPLKNIMQSIKGIFSFIGKKIGKVVKSFAEMFAYTALFVPFAMVFKEVIGQDHTTFQSVIDALSSNSLGKILSTGVGVGMFATKHFMEDILLGLKSFRDRGINTIKMVINKIKSINIKKLLRISKQVTDDTISTLNPFEEEDGYTPYHLNYLDREFSNESKGMKHLKTFESFSLRT